LEKSSILRAFVSVVVCDMLPFLEKTKALQLRAPRRHLSPLTKGNVAQGGSDTGRRQQRCGNDNKMEASLVTVRLPN
jgi:hypothetical protein